ncbi:hypothetical protein GCM10010512_22000 [Streptomyces thermoviolaceus subsp. thermoviolaceus]|uniref:Uncharacterized protein n=1 Tax=Streptomyces thermoviolaceus subsp. thermoviolaceus TaxID=66860 RepID=A0ABX0YRT8_STRTL|nr:hypothetical protein [Streptomyces thermoviolaceus]NJP14001.1 hypothetical protein [Streptomyces thermoviolaceus subsp. thermoviolaceus]WTD50356.1 hypothetical protein OG899_24275 [Streptomyces thermoviolaceus]GHA90220.1 hypothetical protein GCM10010512_22000 [Streptomyces thermoviolaceus subsp. thermoviolaceus]
MRDDARDDREERDDDCEDTGAGGLEDDLLEEELRQAAAVFDPVPEALRQVAVDAYALYDLEARVAELTFDSLTDALPVRGAEDVPRMLTFQAGELSVDVEVGEDGLMGQVLPPGPVRVEVLGGPGSATALAVDELGRFTGQAPPPGPFALRLRTGDEAVVTEWLRA